MNASFVAWCLASTFSYLACLCWSQAQPTRLLEAINNNQLFIFLIANLITGLVNLTINTMEQPLPISLAILSAYGLVLFGMAWIMHKRNIAIRFK